MKNLLEESKYQYTRKSQVAILSFSISFYFLYKTACCEADERGLKLVCVALLSLIARKQWLWPMLIEESPLCSYFLSLSLSYLVINCTKLPSHRVIERPRAYTYSLSLYFALPHSPTH